MAKQIGTPYDDALKSKAEKEAEAIRAYWAGRGFEVKVAVVRNPFTPGQSHPGYTVQTDLINGLPRSLAKPRVRLTADPIKKKRK